jgi:CheY-like chemotaxis protein
MTAGKKSSINERAKILVVDSDKNTMKAYKEVFAEKTKFKIISAAGGREALKKMKTGHFDLVILDVMMPKMSGIDVASAMSVNSRLKKIPVILASALPVASNAFWKIIREHNEFAVVKETVEKPIEVNELLAKIKRVLDKQ